MMLDTCVDAFFFCLDALKGSQLRKQKNLLSNCDCPKRESLHRFRAVILSNAPQWNTNTISKATALQRCSISNQHTSGHSYRSQWCPHAQLPNQ